MTISKGKINRLVVNLGFDLAVGDPLVLCITDCETKTVKSYDAEVECICKDQVRLFFELDCAVNSGWQNLEIKSNNEVIKTQRIFVNGAS